MNALIAKFQQLAPLGQVEKTALAELSWHWRSYDRGEYIEPSDEREQNVTILLNGFACRSKMVYQGFQQIVGFYFPGDFVGLFDVFNRRVLCNIAAMGPCEVAHIRYRALEKVFMRHPSLWRTFAQAISSEALITEAWLINMASKTALQRIAHFLCETFYRLQAVGLAQTDDSFKIQLSSAELGDILALSQVHVSRILQELRRGQFILMDGNHLLVRNVNILKYQCDFEPSYLCIYANHHH